MPSKKKPSLAAKKSKPTEISKHPFLVTLGEHVRELRTQRGLTRKALALAADISERHLANLEYGSGNASILVLLQVAGALHCSLVELLGNGGQSSGASSVVALIGLRGAGKSTLGRMLAEDLGFAFVELSREIEKLAGCSVAEIQALYGLPAYRRYERRALEVALEQHPEAVLATPGGLVSDPATFKLLLARCTTVWLQAKPEDHMKRVTAQGDLRPMAASKEAMQDLRNILAGRSAFYSQAAHQLDTSARPLAATFAALRSVVRGALEMPA